MLDHGQVAELIAKMADTSYPDFICQKKEALALWHEIAADKNFIEQLVKAPSAWGLAQCSFALGAIQNTPKQPYNYSVLSVDGSQIYPDRHQGVACCLINIGSVQFSYTHTNSSVSLTSCPELFFGKDETDKSIDFVNCYRTEQELKKTLLLAKQLKIETAEPFTCLIDGSLIFSYLSSKDPHLKEQFIASYLALLQEFYEQQIPLAAYISLPQSKELISLLRYALIVKHGQSMQTARAAFPLLSDQHLMQQVLKPFERTQLFEHKSEITLHYRQHLKPYFFYFHTGTEIARIEVPAWLAQDNSLFKTVASIIADQCDKGLGYPVVIAEAHEQAVVKADDRAYFYQLIQASLSQKDPDYTISRKSYSKQHLCC
jgi:hypothetical protein